MATVRKQESYNAIEQRRFIKYFVKPKRKVGRPKKRKRKRGRPAYAKTKRERTEERRAEATAEAREKDRLQRTLEGAVAASRFAPKKRINWDTPGRVELRQRIADSWTNKKDMYRCGESFTGFCARVGIDVKTLRRFLKAGGNYIAKKRGRKTLLSESVMRHICEGKYNVHFVRQISHRVMLCLQS